MGRYGGSEFLTGVTSSRQPRMALEAARYDAVGICQIFDIMSRKESQVNSVADRVVLDGFGAHDFTFEDLCKLYQYLFTSTLYQMRVSCGLEKSNPKLGVGTVESFCLPNILRDDHWKSTHAHGSQDLEKSRRCRE